MSGWTDYCPDWSSKDKLRLCSLHDAVTALCLALRERMSPTTRIGFDVGTPKKLESIRNFFNNTPIYGGTQTEWFDNLLRWTAEQYANHTVNSGDFSAYMNQNGNLPRWTWNGLLAGETDTANTRCFDMLDYIYQRYKMINKLRWVYAPSHTWYSAPIIKGEAVASTIPTACDAAIAAAVQTSTGAGGGSALVGISETSGGYRAGAEKYNIIISIFNYSGAQYNDMEASVDVYAKATAPWNNADYFDGGGIFTLNSWSRLQFSEMELPPVLDLNLPWPVNYPPVGGWLKGYNISDGIYGVLKFTGANGFQFKDW